MNDNHQLGDDDFPEWMWEIVDRHDLGERADSPLGAATVLLTDAADDLTEVGRRVFAEQALTPAVMEKIETCAAMLADVLRLAALCPSQPSPGNITKAPDGTLTWAPLGAEDEVCDAEDDVAAASSREVTMGDIALFDEVD